ncbi:MAG: spermidine synthase [Actinomycetota bacterium]
MRRERSSLNTLSALDDTRVQLVLASFLMLFTELALIRTTSALIIYFSYFSNLVLLASFLGVGVGLLRSGRAKGGVAHLPYAVMSITVYVVAFPATIGSSGDGTTQVVGHFGMSSPPAWITVPLLLGLVAWTLASIGHRVGQLFGELQPLEAYRLDIAGSIAGIVVFSLFAFVHAAPVSWAVVIAGVTLALLRPRPGRRALLTLGGWVIVAAALSLVPNTIWSPYQLVSYRADGDRVGISVNSRPHQTIAPIDELLRDEPYRQVPYDHLDLDRPLRSVLIIGAGSGNDVGIALARGAERVVAVEIDPVLYGLGVDLHPDRPYQDARVEVHVDDGRAFLERSSERFDLVIFALPDSLTTVSGQAGIRLESYLFTVEALKSVDEHLDPSGTFAMYNYYRADVFERFAKTISEVWSAPCVFRGSDEDLGRSQGALVVPLGARSSCSPVSEQRLAVAPLAATDDRPFPYLRGRTIPLFYLVTLALILAVSLLVVRATTDVRLGSMRPYVDLFFMGCAFLLLETKNVVGFALLFGTTWFVNSLVFAGILIAVYLAVETARRVRLPNSLVLFGALGVSLLAAWLVDPRSLLGLAVVPRFGAATLLAFCPVFVANLIFAQRFKSVGSSTIALGANVLGAMVGGVLEYAALVTGYRNLLLVVAALYGLAYALRPKEHQPEGVDQVPGRLVQPTDLSLG